MPFTRFSRPSENPDNPVYKIKVKSKATDLRHQNKFWPGRSALWDGS